MKSKRIPSYVIIAVIFIAGIACFWNPPSELPLILENNGVSDPVVDTLTFWRCPKDQYGYKFTGVAQNGKQVTGVICNDSIFFGSWNIRYF